MGLDFSKYDNFKAHRQKDWDQDTVLKLEELHISNDH